MLFDALEFCTMRVRNSLYLLNADQAITIACAMADVNEYHPAQLFFQTNVQQPRPSLPQHHSHRAGDRVSVGHLRECMALSYSRSQLWTLGGATL